MYDQQIQKQSQIQIRVVISLPGRVQISFRDCSASELNLLELHVIIHNEINMTINWVQLRAVGLMQSVIIGRSMKAGSFQLQTIAMHVIRRPYAWGLDLDSHAPLGPLDLIALKI